MKDKDIIQLLKDNLYAFGLWLEAYGKGTGEEMQAKAKEIGPEHFDLFVMPIGWGRNKGTFCLQSHAYRLRKDYKPEAGVEKCEIYEGKTGIATYNRGDTFTACSIHCAPRDYDFIGYLYENGWITSTPRLYVADGKGYPSVGTIRVTVEPETIGAYKVLTPTHVLFRTAQ